MTPGHIVDVLDCVVGNVIPARDGAVRWRLPTYHPIQNNINIFSLKTKNKINVSPKLDNSIKKNLPCMDHLIEIGDPYISGRDIIIIETYGK